MTNWFELWRSLSDHDAIKIMRDLRYDAEKKNGDQPFDYIGGFCVMASIVVTRGPAVKTWESHEMS